MDEFICWLNYEAVQGELFGVHVNLEDVGRVSEFGYFEDCSPALFSTVSLEFSDNLVFLLSFC